MIKSSAPGRCGIIGNPTDMYGGSVISCTIAERAHCTITDSAELMLSVESTTQKITRSSDLSSSGNHLDIPKAVLRHFNLTPRNFKVHLAAVSDIPECAGLAGSTAMVVAIVGAILSYLGIDMDSYSIAETARKIEFGEMGITCGYQDQHMAVFGGLNYMDFRDKERLLQDECEPMATVEPLQHVINDLPMIVAHTGVMRNSGIVHKIIRQRWEEGEKQVVDGYRRIAYLARLGKKALLASDWKTLGELMNENHEIQRDLGGSGPANERLIRAALKGGALGAKLAGAGNGGTIIALGTELDHLEAVLRDAGAESIIQPRPSEGLMVHTTWRRNVLPEAVGGI